MIQASAIKTKTISKTAILEGVLAFCILGLALYLRLVHLRTIPDWYFDEGEFLNAAQNIAQGTWQQMALKGSILFIGRPPLFFLIVASAFRLFGTDIVVLRGVTAILGTLTVGSVYLTGRRILGLYPALLAALFLAILPGSIYYNRMGFTYNWLGFLLVWVVFAAYQYLEQPTTLRMMIAALLAGLAFASDYAGALAIVIVVGAVVLKQPRRSLAALGLACLPVVVIVLPMLLKAPGDFLFDLRTTLAREGGGNSAGGIAFNLAKAVLVYGEMFRREVWVVLGLAGLFVLPDKRLRNLMFFIFLGVFLLFSRARLLGAHYLLPVLPFVALSVGYLLYRGIPALLEIVTSEVVGITGRIEGRWAVLARRFGPLLASLAAALCAFFLIISPLIWLLGVDTAMFVSGALRPENGLVAYSLAQGYVSAADASAVTDYLAPHLQTGDVVAVSPHVGWDLPAHLSSAYNLVAYEKGGQAVQNPGLDQRRFAYDCSLTNTQYVILDNWWRLYAPMIMPDLPELMNQIRQWPEVYHSGSLEVFCNPTRCR